MPSNALQCAFAGAFLLSATSLRAQAPQPVFDAPVLVAGTDSRLDVLLDVDVDGVQDTVGFFTNPANPNQGQVHWHRNLGGMELGPRQVLETVPIVVNRPDHRIVTGDFDGDGIRDFARVGVQDVTVFICTPGFAPSVRPAVPVPGVNAADFMLNAVAGDFDNDGIDDVAFHLFRQGGVGSLVVMRAGPAGAATAGTRTTANPFSLAVVDADSDGDDDLVAATTNLVEVYDAGSTNLTPFQSLNQLVYAYDEVHIAPGDLDGDGLVDLVMFGFDANQEPIYVVHRRSGPASFATESPRFGGPASDLMDLDGDGDLDGVCCGGGGGTPSTVLNGDASKFMICWNEGGLLSSSFSVDGIGSRRLAGLIDADGDGDLDLLGGIAVLYNQAGFAAAKDIRKEVSPMVVEPNQFFTLTDRSPIADFDGDGDTDALARVGGVGAVFRLLRNDGSGRLADSPLDAAPIPSGERWAGPEAHGDFDGDGDVDFLISAVDASNVLIGLQILRNDGNGTFRGPFPAAPAGLARGPAIALGSGLFTEPALVMDVDGDGDPDVVTNVEHSPVAQFQISCRVLLNDGAGFFPNHADFNGLHLFGAADLDADGDVDLYGNLQGIGRGVIPAFGNGNFGSQFITPPSFQRLNAFQVVQLDDDPQLEFLDFDGTGLFPSGMFRVQEFNGTGFTPAQMIGVFRNINLGANPQQVYVSDLNRDGLQDLVVGPVLVPPLSPSRAPVAAIALGTAPGGFAGDPILQSLGVQAMADADSDGDVDLLGSRTWFNIAGGDFPLTDGLRRQFGVSTVGSGGGPAVLGVEGRLAVGSVSRVRLQAGPQAIGGILALGSARVDRPNTPLPGLTIYPRLDLLFAVAVTPGSGAGVLDLSVPPALAGVRLYAQAMVFDPAAPNGLVQTNGVELVHGL